MANGTALLPYRIVESRMAAWGRDSGARGRQVQAVRMDGPYSKPSASHYGDEPRVEEFRDIGRGYSGHDAGYRVTGVNAEGRVLCQPSELFGMRSFDVFLSPDLDAFNEPIPNRYAPHRAAFYAGTMGPAGVVVNGLEMPVEWYRLPDNPNDARYASCGVFPVQYASIEMLQRMANRLPSALPMCGESGGRFVPYFHPDAREEWGVRRLRACPTGSVLNALGELLDGEWLRLRIVGGEVCAELEAGTARGTPQRPAGPPGITGGSRVAVASALALGAVAAVVGRRR